MAALYLRKPGDVQIIQRPIPRPGPEQILVRVECAGVCGSDVHLLHTHQCKATILGHEFAGVVVQVGENVERFQPGQRVCAMPTMGCGHCNHCASGDPKYCPHVQAIGLSMPDNGGFAEYVLVGQHETFLVPDGVDMELAAMVEPLAVGLKQAQLAGCTPGQKMLILGAGPIGLATAVWARALGVGQVLVSDPVASRRALAQSLGATAVVDPGKETLEVHCERHWGGRPDVVIECIGKPGSIDMGTAILKPYGRLVVAGVHMEAEQVSRLLPFTKELQLIYSRMYEKPHYQHTLEMLAQRRIDPRPMVTHRLGLHELPDALHTMSRPNTFGKVMVDPRQVQTTRQGTAASNHH
ncbi:alcohol dehydrogenase catalytic domain-containing protein [Pseudomonas silvicola]|nr:alcohol dehydrogenase catalytic domain-containing protein [Pseudomonas silvicola]